MIRRCATTAVRVGGITVVATTTMVLMAACAEGDTTPTVTAAPANAQVTPTGEQSDRPIASASPATTKAQVAAKTRAADPASSRIKVPNGVGLDYQSAQDRWRAAGLHVAPAKDATGAHRLPLIDANWVVLSQNLKAGSKVPAGTFIRATVKKYSDD